MSDDRVLTEDEIRQHLEHLPGWELRDGWIRRKYRTPGFSHTMLLANSIGFLAEAGWHHPDLSLGYAQVIVKLQTHKVRGITGKDIELAGKIDELATWQPDEGDALEGHPKNWIR